MYTKADSEKLIFQTKIALANATRIAEATGNTLVLRKSPGRIWVVDYLFEVDADLEVIDFINQLSPATKSKAFLKRYSLGYLIISSKTVKKAVERVGEAEVSAKHIYNYELADYLVELQHCLQLTEIAVGDSKKTSGTADKALNEYCIYCWRLVNRHKLKNYSDSSYYSDNFCSVHHPKQNNAKYKIARDALLAAIKHRDEERDRK